MDTSKLDKDSSLKDLKVSGGTMDKAFDKEVMEYSVDIGKKAGEVTITPVPGNTAAKTGDVETKRFRRRQDLRQF